MKKVFTLLSLLCVSLACRAAQPGAELMAKVSSCNAEVAVEAGRAMLRDPHFLDQPIELFGAALQLRRAGFKDDAAFMYLAARLRTMRQMLFQKGDLPQLVAIMQMSIAPHVLSPLEADPALARTIVQRLIEWDRATPDRNRERAQAAGGELAQKLASIDAGLAQLPAQLQADPARIERARKMDADAGPLMEKMHAEQCGPGKPDAEDRKRRR